MRGFALTRYFALSAMLLLGVSGVLLCLLVWQQEIAQLEGAAADRNVSLARIFRHLLLSDIRQLASSAAGKSRAELLAAPAMAEMQARIGPLIGDSDIAKLKVYSPQGMTVFSTEPAQVGEDNSANPGFRTASRGAVVSELVRREPSGLHEGVRQDVDLMTSYVPVVENGELIAVFELYQDVSRLIGRIDESLWKIGGSVSAVMLLLYLLLLFVMRHAQSVLGAQEAALEESNRELDQRVAERTRDLQQSDSRVKQLLREQELIFDNAHVGILLLQERRILKSNQRIADMFGFASPQDYQGCSTEIFYPSPESFVAAGETGYSQMAVNGFASFEVQMRRQNGELFWVIQSGRPLLADAVLEQASIWVYTDVSEQKRAEAELRISAATFDSLEGMMVTDAQGVILRVNRAFCETTGYAVEEVVGRTPGMLKSDRHNADFYRQMWESIAQTGGWQGEIWDRRKNGEVYPKWLTITAVKGNDGAIVNYVGIHHDITERKRAEERIRELAYFDALTHLPNRTLLINRLGRAMTAGKRSRAYGAVLFIDLDHFKMLNDTLGHDRGDLLLQEVAQRLRDCVRAGDTVARLGGDEFVVVMDQLDVCPHAAAAQTRMIGEKLLAALQMVYHLGDIDYHNTASIGAALFHGFDTSLEDLLKHADLAMYKAKEVGRNQLRFFDPAMQTVVMQRSALEAALRKAIEAAQFVLHYQPQVTAAGKVAGAEALVRWLHPQRGMISPAEFIPVAEDSGLIIGLGQWVLTAACEQLAAWAAKPGLPEFSLAVNVSARQFKQPDFVAQVLACIERSGADPRRLKLELTESLLVDNVEEIIAKMCVLKEAGVGFSLDDFGTGYSSLSYLSRLPLDQLKIDRSFVMNIELNDNAVAICAATISLAHSLKLKVVAEGVESEAQRYFLSTVHGCDLIQGYLVSRPLPAAEFEALLVRL